LVVDHAYDEEEDNGTNNTLKDLNTSCDNDG
jgi:hypothetical protein